VRYSARRRLRILLLAKEFSDSVPGGGIRSYTGCLGPALVELGHEVHVLSCNRGQQREDYFDRGMHVHLRPEPPFRGAGRAFRLPSVASRLNTAFSNLSEARRLGGFDVAEAPDWMAEGLLMALKKVCPLIAHLHTPVGIIAREDGQPRGVDIRLADALERYGVNAASLVTSPSHLLADELRTRGWLTRGSCMIVRSPVEFSYWGATESPKGTKPLVLVVGRLEKRKAPELILKAGAQLANDIPQLEIVFVGGSTRSQEGFPYVEWMKRLGGQLGVNCRFVGSVERHQLINWYQQARVVAIPSHFDNFPMVGVEAMAAGRPVVCSVQTGTAELLAGTRAGAVVSSGDPNGWIQGLGPFLRHEATAATAGHEARAIVWRHCSPHKVAEKKVECFKSAIALHGRNKQASRRA
jgi:glycogen synthase